MVKSTKNCQNEYCGNKLGKSVEYFSREMRGSQITGKIVKIDSRQAASIRKFFNVVDFFRENKAKLKLKFFFRAAAVGGAEGGQGDLRSSVNNLLDAMQNLLGGLHLPELPQDADDDDDDDGDDDVNWQ